MSLTFEPVTHVASSMSSFRASQVNKVKLGANIVVLFYNKAFT